MPTQTTATALGHSYYSRTRRRSARLSGPQAKSRFAALFRWAGQDSNLRPWD
jgi:hypothetical protein